MTVDVGAEYFRIYYSIVILPESCTKSLDLRVIKEFKLQIMCTRLVDKLIVFEEARFLSLPRNFQRLYHCAACSAHQARGGDAREEFAITAGFIISNTYFHTWSEGRLASIKNNKSDSSAVASSQMVGFKRNPIIRRHPLLFEVDVHSSMRVTERMIRFGDN